MHQIQRPTGLVGQPGPRSLFRDMRPARRHASWNQSCAVMMPGPNQGAACAGGHPADAPPPAARTTVQSDRRRPDPKAEMTARRQSVFDRGRPSAGSPERDQLCDAATRSNPIPRRRKPTCLSAIAATRFHILLGIDGWPIVNTRAPVARGLVGRRGALALGLAAAAAPGARAAPVSVRLGILQFGTVPIGWPMSFAIPGLIRRTACRWRR